MEKINFVLYVSMALGIFSCFLSLRLYKKNIKTDSLISFFTISAVLLLWLTFASLATQKYYITGKIDIFILYLVVSIFEVYTLLIWIRKEIERRFRK